jgi:transcriptional regulator
MHPKRAFEWTDEKEMLALPPPVLAADGRLQFHLVRRNRTAGHLSGRQVLVSILGRHAYQSANWYVSENQVPTLHYEAGTARKMTNGKVTRFLDLLTKTHERRLEPERPSTRQRMEPGKFEAMKQSIIGFEIVPGAIRGTRKFNQHRGASHLAATIQGKPQARREDIAAAIRELQPER